MHITAVFLPDVAGGVTVNEILKWVVFKITVS